jgi:hypothetical protein
MDHSLTLFHTLRILKALLSHEGPSSFLLALGALCPFVVWFSRFPVVLQLLALTLLSCVLAPQSSELVVRGQGQDQNLLAVHFLLWRCLKPLGAGVLADACLSKYRK